MAAAHRHGMRAVLVVQLGLSWLHSASLAPLGVLVAHLDQSGVSGAWSTVARGGRGLRVRSHLRLRQAATTCCYDCSAGLFRRILSIPQPRFPGLVAVVAFNSVADVAELVRLYLYRSPDSLALLPSQPNRPQTTKSRTR